MGNCPGYSNPLNAGIDQNVCHVTPQLGRLEGRCGSLLKILLINKRFPILWVWNTLNKMVPKTSSSIMRIRASCPVGARGTRKWNRNALSAHMAGLRLL